MKKWLCIIIVLILLAGCSNEKGVVESQEISDSEFILGTIINIRIFDNGSEELIDLSFDRIRDIEAKMSRTLESSDIGRINLMNEARISDETFEVIKKGIMYGEMSQGKFNIALGPITDLWMIGTENARIPEQEEIELALQYVDYKKIKLLENNVVSVEPNMKLDLGGIAKGYAADEVERILVEHGVKSAIINLGGNIKVIGEKPDNTPFNIGIQNPVESRNNYLAILKVSDKTVVTSGDYERFFVEDGNKYHHIFDSGTGYPHVTDVASVTVISDSSIDADALSTILYLMDVKEGIELINRLDGVHCIYVTSDSKVYASDDWIEERLTITDSNFKLQKR